MSLLIDRYYSITFLSPSTDSWVVAITWITFEKAGFHCIHIQCTHTSSNSADANETGTFNNGMH